MKNKALLMLLPVLSIALTSCSGVKNYKEHLEDYVKKMDYHENFNILQLTDIHWNANSSTSASKKYLEKVLAEADRKIKAEQGADAKIDLIELTGDMFMLANAYHVDSFVKFFEKQAVNYGFTYTAIWGNHDRHGLYNPNWLSKKFKNAKHCIYIEPNDNLYGRSNFVINLMDGNQVRWQLANLDSGASFSETSVSPFKDYDYIRDDQVNWWKLEHDKANETVGVPGVEVPTLAYYHIPQDENETLWQEVYAKLHEGKPSPRTQKFFRLEEFAASDTKQSSFIDVAKNHGLKGAFMGHAHNVDWTVEYEGVVIGLGVKTGTELYFAHIEKDTTDEAMKFGLDSIGGTDQNFDLIGASLVTIRNELGMFDLEHLYLNERTSGDFVRWVKW